MKKLIAFLTAVLLFASVSCTAFASGGTITGVYALKGKLFYYNTPTDEIVLTEVKPVIAGTSAETAAKSAEYTELRVLKDGMFFKDKNKLAPEWVNNYADREVWFIAAVYQDGSISIPYLVLDV